MLYLLDTVHLLGEIKSSSFFQVVVCCIASLSAGSSAARLPCALLRLVQ